MTSPAPAHVIPTAPPRWSMAYRLAFRFCFIYFTLYSVTNQILGGLFPIPNVSFPDLSALWPTRPIVLWTAAHVFYVRQPLIFTETGSGDRTFDWVLSFCVLITAVLGTAIWSMVDARRAHYEPLHKWFRLFMRFALGSEMILYGMVKAVPLQMPFPFLMRLLEPFGNFSPMGVLWSSIGASPAYETFTGCVEMFAGILLFFPRTTLAGALVCMGSITEVFMLNMTYDVPVKLFSFHLLLMVLILLAPYMRGLADLLFLKREAAPTTEPQLFSTPRANRIALAAQIIFGMALVAGNAYGAWTSWHTYGGGSPRSPLYGIWAVDQMSIDGRVRPTLLNDADRWRRAIFDTPNFMAFQHMDDTYVRCNAAINAKNKAIELTQREDPKWKAKLAFQRVANRLMLDGDMDKHKVHIELQRIDLKFLLQSRSFHWIQENPFNR